MTEKLYYIDSHMSVFTAAVLSCQETKKGYAVVLDKTAFFPEGGGQSADTGYIGDVRVLDAQEQGDEVLHYVDGPLEVGAKYPCRIDFEQRLRRMPEAEEHRGAAPRLQ